jgi:biopolymer transport protein ExbB/TolQ
MLLFIKQMGPFGYLMIIISIVIAALAIKKATDLFRGGDRSAAELESGLHAILFWGVISAVLGVLGQISGIYNALNAIYRASEIDPRIVFMGFAESFTTTLYGLTTMLISAVIWFALFMRYRKLVGTVKSKI